MTSDPKSGSDTGVHLGRQWCADKPPCQCQRGQSMIEYVVVCAAVALVLGIGMINPDSILWQLIDAFQRAYRNFSYAISLPT